MSEQKSLTESLDELGLQIGDLLAERDELLSHNADLLSDKARLETGLRLEGIEAAAKFVEDAFDQPSIAGEIREKALLREGES